MAGPLPRVVIDLEKLRHINCGLGRFSLHLGRELLDDADGRFEPVLLLPQGAERHFAGRSFDRIDVQPWRKEFLRRHLRPWVRPFLPPANVALWHVTNQMSKYLPLDDRVPVLLTIHDLNFLHEAGADRASKRVRRKLADIQDRVRRAAAVVTDSAFVARDLAAHVDLGDTPVHVVPLGLSAPPPASPTRPAFLPEGAFLLSIGHAMPHKNFHVLFDMLEHLPGPRLMVAGKVATPYGAFLLDEVARRGLSDRVVMPGEVSDGDRQWLYEHCEAFLFPSLTEGFGFPVLEAMQCGKPVFMSRATSLPEVAGDCGFFFDSHDGPALATTYRTGMDAVARDPHFTDRARAHAASFSWRATARSYADIYASMLCTQPRAACA